MNGRCSTLNATKKEKSCRVKSSGAPPAKNIKKAASAAKETHTRICQNRPGPHWGSREDGKREAPKEGCVGSGLTESRHRERAGRWTEDHGGIGAIKENGTGTELREAIRPADQTIFADRCAGPRPASPANARQQWIHHAKESLKRCDQQD